jgi:hypothetical protein
VGQPDERGPLASPPATVPQPLCWTHLGVAFGRGGHRLPFSQLGKLLTQVLFHSPPTYPRTEPGRHGFHMLATTCIPGGSRCWALPKQASVMQLITQRD